MIDLTGASISVSAGAQKVPDALKQRWLWFKQLFANSACDQRALLDKAAFPDLIIEVIRKIQDQQTFVPLPHRWVVERTFGWKMRWHRLVRDYEQCIDVSRRLCCINRRGGTASGTHVA